MVCGCGGDGDLVNSVGDGRGVGVDVRGECGCQGGAGEGERGQGGVVRGGRFAGDGDEIAVDCHVVTRYDDGGDVGLGGGSAGVCGGQRDLPARGVGVGVGRGEDHCRVSCGGGGDGDLGDVCVDGGGVVGGGCRELWCECDPVEVERGQRRHRGVALQASRQRVLGDRRFGCCLWLCGGLADEHQVDVLAFGVCGGDQYQYQGLARVG